MTILWTERDLDIVETLTRRVRLLNIEQIARIWWPANGGLRVIRRRLQRLIDGRLLHQAIVNAHPPVPVSSPLTVWKPGDDAPDPAVVSAEARNRWTEAAVPTDVYFASQLGANLFGSTAGRLPDFNHRDHDLLFGDVYAIYRTSRPDEAGLWVGEDALSKAGYRIKDPDAFLVNEYGQRLRVIESTGRYSVRQVESFHEYCVERDLPYELW